MLCYVIILTYLLPYTQCKISTSSLSLLFDDVFRFGQSFRNISNVFLRYCSYP